jgi:hypothetical protein
MKIMSIKATEQTRLLPPSRTDLRERSDEAQYEFLTEEFARIREANASDQPSHQGMPTPDNPSWENRSPGMWTMEMEGFHSKDPYLSHPSHSMLERMTDQLSVMSCEQSLTDVAQKVFRDRGDPRISSANPEKQTYFVPHSVTPQYDMQVRVDLEPEFADLLGVRTDGLFDTSHVFLKNGLNGITFTDVDGSLVETQYCQAGSWDREAPTLQMARRVAPLIDGQADPRAPSYYYTGRTDTYAKAVEQGRMIYFSELQTDAPKGIEEDHRGRRTQHFVVNSIQSNSPLYKLGKKKRGTEGAEQEQDYFQREKLSLTQLRNTSHDLEDPVTSEEHSVRFRPMLFSRQVNVFANLEPVLDSFYSGGHEALETSREGWKELKAYYHQHLDKIPEGKEELAAYLVERLEHSYNGRLLGWQMHAAEELACRSMLCILLELPVVDHCKSSTDRTSVLGALDETLNQWISEGMDIPEKFETIIDDPRFKEFFWINWSKAAQFTRNARSPAGIIEQNGFIRENDHEAIGVSINKDISQCVLLEKFLPEACLKSYGISGFLKQYSWKYGLFFFFWFIIPIGLVLGATAGIFYMPLMTLGMFLFNWIKYIFLPVTLLFAVPNKVVDFDAPGIGPRRHVKEAKDYQRPFARPLEAVPANAGLNDPTALAKHMGKVHGDWEKEELDKNAAIENYNLLFQKRFCQRNRALRYFLKGDVLERMREERAPKPPTKWELNGQSYRSLDDVYDALLDDGFSRREATHIVHLMEDADNLSAHRYLERILEAPTLQIGLSDPSQEEMIVSFDTRRQTLTIESQAELIDTSNSESHAMIFTETVINADPSSDDYGQGYITTELPRREDGSWEFRPIQ